MKSSLFDLDLHNFSLMLLDLREEFEQLFLFTIGDYKLVCRPMYLSELRSLVALSAITPSYVVEEWVMGRSVLIATCSKSYLFDDSLAGTISGISTSIINKSNPGGVSEISKMLDAERQKLEMDDGLVDCTMLAGVGALLGKNYKRITAREQSKYLAISESITGKKLEVQTLSTQTTKGGKPKKLSPEAAAILSKESADRPDIDADNKMFRAL